MKFSLLFCIFFVAINYSEACKCIQRHPQVHYCTSDFTIICKVLKRTEMPNERDVVYTVSNIQKLRARNGAYWILKSGKIYTAAQSATCGANLEIGKRYLMTGSISNKKARINTCGYIRLLSDVSSYTRKGFKNFYKYGCDCKVEDCVTDADCQATPGNNTCKLNRNKYDCYADYTVCLPDSDEVCKWEEEDDFEDCLV